MENFTGTLILIIIFVGVTAIIAYYIHNEKKYRRNSYDYNKSPYIERFVDKHKIEQKVDLLHRKLPKKPTAINGIFVLPNYLKDEVLKSNFSQSSIQKIADHIAAFLGLVSSVKVKIGIESSYNMMASKSQLNNADQVGLYTVKGTFNREIQITKKYIFNIEHILAILAHESAHNYLYYYNITENNEEENEVLTDIACAYIGLGELLINGYQPIECITNHEFRKIKIGYLSPYSIEYAIALSAIKRNLKELVSPLSSSYKKYVNDYYKRKKKEQQKKNNELSRINNILNEISLLKKGYNNCLDMYEKHLKNINNIKISPEDSKIMVEMANSFSIGNIKQDIDIIIDKLNLIKNHEVNNKKKFIEMSKKSKFIDKKLSNWFAVLKKYSDL